MKCHVCHAELPPDATYCIECGAAVSTLPPAETGPTRPLETEVLAPPARADRRVFHLISATILVVGLVFLVLTRLVLPGIFVLAGIIALVESIATRRTLLGVHILVWATGLTLLLRAPRLLVPGLLILAGFSLVTYLLATTRS